jgi:hypothetical protein
MTKNKNITGEATPRTVQAIEPRNTKYIGIRIPEILYAKIKEYAIAENLDINNDSSIIKRMLRETLINRKISIN